MHDITCNLNHGINTPTINFCLEQKFYRSTITILQWHSRWRLKYYSRSARKQVSFIWILCNELNSILHTSSPAEAVSVTSEYPHTRWRLSALLIRLPHWRATEELCWLRNVWCVYTQNHCPYKMVAVGKRLTASIVIQWCKFSPPRHHKGLFMVMML